MGVSGFTTQNIKRCQTMTRACALVYNWWSWYCRAAHPGTRREAITSPLLLAAVGKAVNHANQTTLYLTPLQGAGAEDDHRQYRRGLQHLRQAAEQFAQASITACIGANAAPR